MLYSLKFVSLIFGVLKNPLIKAIRILASSVLPPPDDSTDSLRSDF